MRIIPYFVVFSLSLTAPVATYAEKPIRVGVIAPLSGPAAELGTQIRNGIELAKADLKSKVEFVYEDEACNANMALTAAQKLSTSDNVPVIIGPLCSPPFLSVAPILNRAKITFIHSSSGTQNTASQKGDYGIEGTATVMEENARLAEYVKGLGHKSAAVIHFEQEWATGHANAFVAAFENLGGKIVANEAFTNANETDFRPYVLKVRVARPDAIFIGAFNGQTGAILKQLRASGVVAPVFAQYDVEDPAFLDAAGNAANGVQYMYPFDNTKLTDKAATFQKRYQAAYNTIPSFYSYNGYDIAVLVDDAVSRCGSDSLCIRRQIVSTKDFHGLTGVISFNEQGNISRNFIVKEVRDMQFRRVGE